MCVDIVRERSSVGPSEASVVVEIFVRGASEPLRGGRGRGARVRGEARSEGEGGVQPVCARGMDDRRKIR